MDEIIMQVYKSSIKDSHLINLINGTKKAGIILNDEDYQVNDILKFYDKQHSTSTNHIFVYFKITHIYSGIGLERNYICASLKQTKKR